MRHHATDMRHFCHALVSRRAPGRIRRGNRGSIPAGRGAEQPPLPEMLRVLHFCNISGHMRWTVDFLDAAVLAELEAQPRDVQARFLRIVDLIESHGLERVREPYVKHRQGRLWGRCA